MNRMASSTSLATSLAHTCMTRVSACTNRRLNSAAPSSRSVTVPLTSDTISRFMATSFRLSAVKLYQAHH